MSELAAKQEEHTERPVSTRRARHDDNGKFPEGNNGTDPDLNPRDVSPYLNVPRDVSSARKSSDTISDVSLYSADNENERQLGRLWSSDGRTRWSSRSPAAEAAAPAQSWRGKTQTFWTRNKGLALVVLSQLCGGLMSVSTRLLEVDDEHGEGMDTLQVLFARMSITLVLSSLYLHYAKIPDAPFGKREVRGLLVARGMGGFFGVYGLYYSLKYLALSEATVITFLAPITTCWVCSILLKEQFTRKEQVAGLVSFLGVILIARPASLFGGGSENVGTGATGLSDGIAEQNSTAGAAAHVQQEVSPTQRMIAVAFSLVGVMGATCAYTTIRWIGKRAHPLISVNYFATWCTIVSTVALLFVPSVPFKLPSSFRQWGLLIFLGISGFATQFLLTAGLQYEKGSRATNMVYTSMLFALAFDKIVWNHTPGLWSIVGSSLILGSALFVAVQKQSTKEKDKALEGAEEETAGLITVNDEAEDDRESNGGFPLRGVQEVQLRAMRV